SSAPLRIYVLSFSFTAEMQRTHSQRRENPASSPGFMGILVVYRKDMIVPSTTTRFLVALLFCLAFGAVTVKADPITFSNVVALQNGGSSQVDLFSNPGATIVGPQLNFLIHVSGVLSPGQVDALR